ncbi:MAG: GNAT family N-acetyltransferase [Parerythrobacter sp.]
MTITPARNGLRTEYAMRYATDDDLPQILDLLRSNLSNEGVTSKTRAFWAWKHCNAPAGPSPVLVATAPDEKVIGLRAAMRFDVIELSGKVIHALRPVDTATHDAWQRKGIFSNLTLELIRDLRGTPVQLLFNTPNNNSLPAYLKLGWQVVQTVSICITAGSLRKILSNYKPTGTYPDADRVMRDGTRVSIRRFNDIDREERESLLAICEDYEAARPRSGLRTVRNRVTLSWRYSHPTAEYRILRIYRSADSIPIGIVVFRIESRKGLRGALLIDLFKCPETGITSILTIARRAIGVAFYAYAISEGSSEYDALSRGLSLTVRQVNLAQRGVDVEDKIFDNNHWDISLADIEMF